MPSTTAHIPWPNRGSSTSLRGTCQPAFSAPVRWTLAVLAWLAFGVAAYLAWRAVTGSSVAGCGMGSSNFLHHFLVLKQYTREIHHFAQVFDLVFGQ